MKHITHIEIHTDEPVSPECLVLRIAQACGRYGALRPGEQVFTAVGKGGHLGYTISAKSTPSPFGG